MLLHPQVGCGLTRETSETGKDGVWKTLALTEGSVDSGASTVLMGDGRRA